MEGDDTDGRDHADTAPVLLYDGVCGFCDRTVRFVLDRDPDGPMRFAPLQGRFAAAILAAAPDLAGVDSLILVEPAEPLASPVLHTRSEAALWLGRYIGGPWRLLAAISRFVPRRVRDAAYDLFARHRYRLFGHLDSCRIPAAPIAHRFMD